jgi:hypothetical protein
MKSLLQIIGCSVALFSAVRSVHAQGLVNFNNRVTGVIVAPVYGPEPGDATVAKSGNTPSGTPAGSTTYGGALLSGANYTAELWGGPAGATELSRLATTTFKVGTLSGFVVAPAAPVAVSGVPPGGTANLQLRAWDNRGGTVLSWSAAQSNPRTVASGASPIFASPPLGDGMLNPAPNLTGLRSFNIHLLGPPVFTVRSVDSCPRNATLHFTINPGGNGFSYQLVYGPTPAMALSGPSGGFNPGTYGDFPVDLSVAALAPGTPYYFGLVVMDLTGNFTTALGQFTTPPDALPAGTGTGLFADYFDGLDFTGRRTVRIDPTVDFDWGDGVPHPAIGADYFSARWTGKVQPRFSDTYTFYTLSDDGVRLWVNGQLLIDNWTDHGPTENSGAIALGAGQRYDLRLEFYEKGGGAVARLFWSSTCLPKEIIPRTQLYPVPECVTAPDDILGWWPGNGASYDIVGRNDGTLHAGVNFSAGLVGQAFDFDGVAAFVQVPGSTWLAGPRTVETWVYPRTHAGSGMPIVTAGVGGAGDIFGVAGTSGNFNCNIGQDELYLDHWGTACLDSGLRLKPNGWNHVAFTYDGTTVRFYLNGVAGASFAQTLYDYYINTLTLGGNRIGGTTTRASLDGQLDETTIYSRALSPEEIQMIHLAGAAGKCRPWTPPACTPVPTPDPRPPLPREPMFAWWTGDGTAQDRLGKHPGSWSGTPSYAAGKVGSAFSFVGQSSYVRVINAGDFNPEPADGMGGFSIEAWIKVDRWAGNIVVKGTEYSLSLVNGSEVMMRMGTGSGSTNPVCGGSGSTNRWHHVAGVFSFYGLNTRVYVYLDGVQVCWGSGSFPQNTTLPLLIGNGVFGRVDEVCLYKGALTEGQIAMLYAAGTGGKCWRPVLTERWQPSGSSLQLAWPVSERWYRPQQSPVASGGPWSNIAITPVCANDECTVLLPLAPGSAFFRLIEP